MTTASDRPRVLVVIGTRPEVIKMAPVIAALRRRSDEAECAIAFTGQHTDLVTQLLPVFDISPDYDLGIMREGQTLYDVARRCLDGLREVVARYSPDLVLVQGDTGTVFFSALASFFEKTMVGHVEAGLRSGRKWAPFPEEVLRCLTDTVADLHFAPTATARDNLLGEGTAEEGIFVTGNTVIDSLIEVADRHFPVVDPTLSRLLAGERRLLLVTAHRRESFGDPIREVFRAVREIVDGEDGIEALYPVHPNPNVQKPARELLSGHSRIHLTGPLGYPDFVTAMKSSALILTDSGGVQEEAPTFGTPVLLLREVTERPEAFAMDRSMAIVGTKFERIVSRARHILAGPDRGESPAGGTGNPYGDGRAGERIADIVISALTGVPRTTTDWRGP